MVSTGKKGSKGQMVTRKGVHIKKDRVNLVMGGYCALQNKNGRSFNFPILALTEIQ